MNKFIFLMLKLGELPEWARVIWAAAIIFIGGCALFGIWWLWMSARDGWNSRSDADNKELVRKVLSGDWKEE